MATFSPATTPVPPERRPGTISEWRDKLNLPRDDGLSRRQVMRRFERWLKDKRCKYIVIEGALLDSMPIPNIVVLNAFYTPDDGLEPEDSDIYVMRLGNDE